jgi:hypothetical protein
MGRMVVARSHSSHLFDLSAKPKMYVVWTGSLTPGFSRRLALSPFRHFALSRPLPGPMRSHLRSVPASAHAAPTTPVILCRIVK